MVISIYKFLSSYYGITVDAGKELTHKLAKRTFNLKGCPFSYAAKNPNLIKEGNIIYVKDSHDVILPYICPNKILTSVKECEYTKEEIVSDNLDDVSIIKELATLPDYIVHELLSRYKTKPSFYRIIKKELISRGVYDNKKYKLRKEIVEIELEEGEYDDKYQRRRRIKCKKS